MLKLKLMLPILKLISYSTGSRCNCWIRRGKLYCLLRTTQLYTSTDYVFHEVETRTVLVRFGLLPNAVIKGCNDLVFS